MSKEMMSLIGIIVYLVAMLIIGIYGYKKTDAKNMHDMFIAKGGLNAFIVFITGLAMGLTAFAFMGCPSSMYLNGVESVIYMAPLAADLALLCVVGRAFWLLGKRYNYITPADLLSGRYGYKGEKDRAVRWIVSIGCFLFSVFTIQIQFTACGYVVDVVTGGMVSYEAAIVGIAIITGVYTVLGGMNSVAWTDVVQAFLLMGVTISICVIGVVRVGSGDLNFWEAVINAKEDFGTFNSSLIWGYTNFLGVALAMAVIPIWWQRFYTGKKLMGTVGGVANAEWIQVLTLCSLFPAIIGGAAIVLFPGLEGFYADRVTILFVEFVPALVAGLFAAGALAASMSTADATTLLVGSIVVKDVYAELKPNATGKQMENFSRLVCLLVIVFSLIISLNPPAMIIQTCNNMTWPAACAFMPVVLGAIYWKRGTREGAIAALISAWAFVFIVNFIGVIPFEISIMVWSFLISGVVFVVVSLMTPAPPERINLMFTGFLKETHKYKNIVDEDDVKWIKVPGLDGTEVPEKMIK